MAAANTDKLNKVGLPGTATTLSAPGFTAGGTSINVGSTTNWPTDTGVIFAIDTAEVVNGEEVRVDGSLNVFIGTVNSGTSINNMVKLHGTAQDYAAGSLTRVYIQISALQHDRLIDALLAEHNQDGSHGDVDATTVDVSGNATVGGTLAVTGVETLTSHLDVNDASTAIRDSSDNELVKFAKTASAVNEITITNAATGGDPKISGTGGDSNIFTEIAGKGNAGVTLQLPRQDNTTNSYPTGALVQYGYGVNVPGAAASFSETVTFPVAYAAAPIVVICGGGDDTGASTSLGAGGAERQAFYMSALSVTATNFSARGLATANWTAGDTAFYHWIAIGVPA